LFDPELMNRAVRRIAEDRIREAEERGLFDNLSGHGKPLPPIEEGLPEQHLMSWVRSWMRREGLSEAQRELARGDLARLKRTSMAASPADGA
jgi:hypothetical protein